MKCPKCGNENNDDSKFCKECGEPLKASQPRNNNKLIITVLIVVVIFLIGGVIYASGILTPEIPMENQDFKVFTLDIPVGSNYVITDQAPDVNGNMLITWANHGDYAEELYGIFIGKNLTKKVATDNEFVEKNGNMEIYKNETPDGTIYSIYVTGNNSQLYIFGTDLNALKRAASSFKEEDLSALKTTSTPAPTSSSSSSQTTSSQQQSPSSPISIKGGSFSTGSAEEDKTYASIYVGKEHAGESVTVQIWYSRDGNTLNNGNMVPVTVHSDGYIEVASADAYHYYPDYATINLYDSAGKLLDSRSVSLSPESGTQTF